MGTVYYWLYYKWQTNTFSALFLPLRDPVKFRFRIVKFDVGIGVQRDADIRVTHDILQGFGIHAAARHVGAEGMATYMGRDFRKLNFVNAVVFLQNMLEVMLPMEGDHRHIVLVQEQKAGVAVDHRFFKQLLTVIDNPAEAGHDFITHGDEPLAVLGFGVLDDIGHVPGMLQLVIHPDPLVLKVNVRNGQSAEFRYTQARIEQDVDPIVILTEVLVLLYEFQKGPLLGSGDGFPCDTVIDHHCCQRELKWVLADQIVLPRHLKGRAHHATDGMNGTVVSSNNHSCVALSILSAKDLHSYKIHG